jgi:hypothetical protein
VYDTSCHSHHALKHIGPAILQHDVSDGGRLTSLGTRIPDDEGDAAYGLPGYKSLDGHKQRDRRVVLDYGMEAAREAEAAQPNPAVLDILADLAKSVLAFLPILEEWLRVAVKVQIL